MENRIINFDNVVFNERDLKVEDKKTDKKVLVKDNKEEKIEVNKDEN